MTFKIHIVFIGKTHTIIFSLSHLVSQVITVAPTKTVTLQCVFLTPLEKDLCNADQNKGVHLTWVDETGNVVHKDPQHDVNNYSDRDITLTVTYQSTGQMRFRCQATVGEQVKMSDVLLVLASGESMTCLYL